MATAVFISFLVDTITSLSRERGIIITMLNVLLGVIILGLYFYISKKTIDYIQFLLGIEKLGDAVAGPVMIFYSVLFPLLIIYKEKFNNLFFLNISILNSFYLIITIIAYEIYATHSYLVIFPMIIFLILSLWFIEAMLQYKYSPKP